MNWVRMASAEGRERHMLVTQPRDPEVAPMSMARIEYMQHAKLWLAQTWDWRKAGDYWVARGYYANVDEAKAVCVALTALEGR